MEMTGDTFPPQIPLHKLLEKNHNPACVNHQFQQRKKDKDRDKQTEGQTYADRQIQIHRDTKKEGKVN